MNLFHWARLTICFFTPGGDTGGNSLPSHRPARKVVHSTWWDEKLIVQFSVKDPWHFGIESGSPDPYLWLRDPDSDPDAAIVVSDLQDLQVFLELHLHHFSKIKNRNQGFPYYFYLIEGSRRPKNIRIRRRIRIRNTSTMFIYYSSMTLQVCVSVCEYFIK